MAFSPADTQTNPGSSSDTAQKKSSSCGHADKSAGTREFRENWQKIRETHGSIVISENVFRPPHYIEDGGVECIDVMIQLYGIERVREWAEITAFQYQWRQGRKQGNPPEQDKKKAIWYTRFSMGDDPRDD